MATQKPTLSHFEGDHLEPCDDKAAQVVAETAIKAQATSGYEALTLWQTVTTFKVATAVCFFAAFSAATDGYQIGSVFVTKSRFTFLVMTEHSETLSLTSDPQDQRQHHREQRLRQSVLHRGRCRRQRIPCCSHFSWLELDHVCGPDLGNGHHPVSVTQIGSEASHVYLLAHSCQ
jgi:hypothetical protein